MSWYYAEGGKQIGPVMEPDWNALVSGGTIKPETLVWREGMANWMPFATASLPGGATDTPAAGSVRCSECGRLFSPDEVVTLDGQPVCAACKPIALQKIKEGVQLTGEMRYAGFWVRFAAKFIDGIILQVVVRGLGLVLGIALNAAGNHSTAAATISGIVLGTLAGGTYAIFFNGKYGATPGKMACKLRIVRADGSAISYGRACGRYFAELLSSLTLLIGYIMTGFDEEKRALHDRIADTRVIRL